MEKTTKERLEVVLIEWIEGRKDHIDNATIAAIPEVARVLLDLMNTKKNATVAGVTHETVCKNCKHLVDDEDRFCQHCGVSIKK